MATRSNGRSGIVRISVRHFGWPAAAIATLRHSTLPWGDPFAEESSAACTPLTQAQLGSRDRLSLVAQFAAHQALLRFAGISEGELDPSDWAVVLRRGSDCRLLRLAARATEHADAVPPLTVVHQFAEVVDAPRIQVLSQSWGRPEAVFLECFRMLREDAAADLRWARRSAYGAILSPGIEGLETLLAAGGSATYSDELCVDALHAASVLDSGRSVVFIRGNGIHRYSALGDLRNAAAVSGESEAAAAEKIAGTVTGQRVIFCVADPELIDEPSRRVLQILRSIENSSWITPSTPSSLPESRWFVVSPRLEAARELEKRLATVPNRRQAIETFVASPSFDAYVDYEMIDVPDGEAAMLAEPLRSYVGALAFLGRSSSREVATEFLTEFLCDRTLEDLAVEGMSFVDEEGYHFVSEAAQSRAARMLAPASAAAVSRVAAAKCEESGDLVRAATLLIAAGDNAIAVDLLDRVSWSGNGELIRVVQSLPVPARAASHRLSRALTRALIEEGRYRDARDSVAALPLPERDLALARIERRTGDYGPALARLERLPRSCESDLLRADILGVLRRDVEAREILASTEATAPEEAVLLAYTRVLVGMDGELASLPTSALRDYFAARLRTYRALEQEDYAGALASAEEALRSATNVAYRIDALLDRVYALFSSGSWDDARRAALDALADVEQTQGDRAAGGLLFLLAYLCADDGQWAHARHRIARLRLFYAGNADERHLREIELLEAHLHFSRGEFDEAERVAKSLLTGSNDAPVRAAGELILAECESISGRPPQLVHDAGNVEFRDRAALLAARAAGAPQPFVAGKFTRALLEWESCGGPLPLAATGSEKLKLFRSCLATGRRRDDRVILAHAAKIAAELGIAHGASDRSSDDGVRFLRIAATREFPFAPRDFDRPWRFASRNRLGRWNEIGSMPSLPGAELDRIATAPACDWVVCSENELLYVEGIGSWPQETRDALAATFRQRAELYRLRRAAEQEQNAEKRGTAAVAGVIGDSPALRDLITRATLIARRDLPVCILGESGSGKELIARAIHAASGRRHKTFTPVNCAALPDALIESELFGHARGAFTGADRDRPGLIEVTDGGTLFLDEIGEMPLAAQAKLLRFLQDGEFRRVGEPTNRTADVRIVTATNRKLEAAVEQGRFREDLYYRVRGIELVLPPLRDRGSDVLLLASHFLAAEREKHRGGPSHLSSEVETLFLSHDWPGNVRELQNVIRAAHAVAADARQITIEHLPEQFHLTPARPPAGSYQEAVSRFRRDLIQNALAQTNGNQNRAAAILRISRQALGYQIRELGIMTGRQLRRIAM